jgi:hypothetical protein
VEPYKGLKDGQAGDLKTDRHGDLKTDRHGDLKKLMGDHAAGDVLGT